MLELKSVSWQNFLSYGDYPTTIELDQLGQCLIVGEIEDEEDKNPENIKKSNGAGKSTIPNVIQWALFGRTMHSRSPGDNIINWFTGKNCWAKVTFKNGDSITRTRNTEGKNELIYSKDGDESRFITDTLSTAQNQQQQLNKIFNLDWEIFCGSVFFNQYGKPWMEMADVTRKKTIERILHVDRLTYYAQSAKEKCDGLDKLNDRFTSSTEDIKSSIERLTQEKERLKSACENFDQNKQDRIDNIKNRIISEGKTKADLEVPDVEKLRQKWVVVRKIQEKLAEIQKDHNKLKANLAESEAVQNSLKNKVKDWTKKSGQICINCEQNVESTHIASKIDPIKKEIESLEDIINKCKEKIKNNSTLISNAEKILNDRKPSMTIEEANRLIESHKRIENEIKKLNESIENVKNEGNPHIESLNQIDLKLKKYEDKLADIAKESERSDFLYKHYHYIYKAYNDRSKIKSYIFRDHLPFINSRLKHYLEIFGLDVKIEMTDALGISSNMWGYEFESGGERKRTDVAFMLAMFDFHEQMYGRQCNILVLDEVDGRLDDDGIDALIKIIKNDLAHRVESILIISHRNMMFDTFNKEMRVIRKNRFSYLEAI